MFEITPKEQILKNVRKGLVQPVPNIYPLLDNDSPNLNPSTVLPDETFLKQYTAKGSFFAICDNIFDFLSSLLKLQQQQQWPLIVCSEKYLTDIMRDNGMEVSADIKEGSVFLTTCQRLSPDQNTVYFSSEFQNLKAIEKSGTLLLYATQKQIEAAGIHSVFNELSIKRDIRVAFDIGLLGAKKQVYLFLNVNS